MVDPRYGLLKTMDHLPCEMVRTLWLIQDLERKQQNDPKYARSLHLIQQAKYLQGLVDENIEWLHQQKRDLNTQMAINKRFLSLHSSDQANTNSRPALGAKVLARGQRQGPGSKPQLLIKIKLPPRRVVRSSRGPRIVHTARGSRWGPGTSTQDTFCVCHDVSYGPMIACDNNRCPRGEWFHYNCVGIQKVPQGQWFCSDQCREEST